MLRRDDGPHHSGTSDLSHGTNMNAGNPEGETATRGNRYISHGAFGLNGLYRAHSDSGTKRDSVDPARAIRSGIVAKAFGDAPARATYAPNFKEHEGRPAPLPCYNVHTRDLDSKDPRPQAIAGFGGGTSRSPVGRFGTAGESNLSHGPRPNYPNSSVTMGEQVRTPELQLLVVDEDASSRAVCSDTGAAMGFQVTAVPSVSVARGILIHQKFDLLMVDLQTPGGASVLALVEEVKTTSPRTAVVVLAANASLDSAVEALRLGAGDYLTKPLAAAELSGVLQRVGHNRQFDIESRLLRERLRTPYGMGKIVGRSPEMEKLYRILSKVAHSTHPVLILGESGTGKELVARSIHDDGPNTAKPFIPVDCSSLVPTLMESELFGYVKGAFTGANRTKEGLLAAADGGTVFLDEIGEIPLDMQAKLLRALQEKEVRPVGATHSVPITARVLAATNRDLAQMVEQGRFRKDLYFRLSVVNLRIPPLRDRREDIPVLAMHFLQKMRKHDGVEYDFSPDAWRTMTQFNWPGNVRELEHAIERACALCSGTILEMGDLPSQLQDFRLERQKRDAAEASAAELASPQGTGQRDSPGPIRSIADMERHAILETIEYLDGDKLQAAKLLGIGKTTLYRKLKEYGLGEESEGGN